MANAHTFRFLDLPKEIRLMVYERIPCKVKHHAYEGLVDSSNWFTMQLVYTNLPGILVLATCQQICSEAEPILRPHLIAIRKQPVRLIMSTDCGTRALVFLSRLTLSRPSRTGSEDIRSLINIKPSGNFPPATDSACDPMPRRVEIALRDTPIDQDAMRSMTDYQRQFLVLFKQVFNKMTEGWNRADRDPLHVRVRVGPTSLSADDQGLSGETGGRSLDLLWNWVSTVETLPRGAEGIEKVEWERDWAEGECYF